MKFRNAKNTDKLPEHVAALLEESKKAEEERERIEEENDKRSASELSIGEVKHLIHRIYHYESLHGNQPILSNQNREKIFRIGKWCLLGFLGFGLYYYFLMRETNYYMMPFGQKLIAVRTTKGSSSVYQFVVRNNRWFRCLEDGSSCTTLFTPVEADFEWNTKIVFTSGGRAYWIKKDNTDIRQVKLVDGIWSFEEPDKEERWRTFDSLPYPAEDDQ